MFRKVDESFPQFWLGMKTLKNKMQNIITCILFGLSKLCVFRFQCCKNEKECTYRDLNCTKAKVLNKGRLFNGDYVSSTINGRSWGPIITIYSGQRY